MKKQIITIVTLAATLAVSAQDISKEKLVGLWKITAVEIEGMKVTNVNDPDEWAAVMFENDLKKEPGKVFTAEDSMAVGMGAAMMQTIVSKMDLFFRDNGKYGMLKGKTPTEKEMGTYRVKKDMLVMEEEGEEAEVRAQMPDANTLILIDFVKEGLTLIYKKG